MNFFDAILGAIYVNALLCLYRLSRGPAAADRVVAFDGFGFSTMALLVVLAIRHQAPFLLDVVAVLALIGFLGTSAFGKYIHRGHIRE